MKCAICGFETRPGQSNELLERDGGSVVVRGVPAEICTNCGEVFFELDVAEKLYDIADAALSRELDPSTKSPDSVPAVSYVAA